MRIALISDIHGNLISLDAVLADIERQQIDTLICLGDVVAPGPQPREVIERLRELNCLFVAGNFDAAVLDVEAMARQNGTSPVVIEAVKWCAQQLSEDQLDFLRTFHPFISLRLDGGIRLLCCHGSPGSNTSRIYATTPDAELDALLEGSDADVLAAANTHVQMLRSHGEKLIVNPGSVGVPVTQTPSSGVPGVLPEAKYAILTTTSDGIGVDLRRVRVDLDAIRRAELASTNPFSWAEMWP